MNGTKSKMVIGFKPIKIGEEEYDTKLGIDDTADYIKTVKNVGLKIQFYAQEKDIDNVVKESDGLLDYKINFVKQALKSANQELNVDELVANNIKDIISDGKIEVWLGFMTQKELDESKKVKN